MNSVFDDLGLVLIKKRDLQDYAEKHHSPTRDHKTKWRKAKPLYKIRTDKPPKTETQ